MTLGFKLLPCFFELSGVSFDLPRCCNLAVAWSVALLVDVKYSKCGFAAKSAQSEIGVGFADRLVGFIRQKASGRVCRAVIRWRENGSSQNDVGQPMPGWVGGRAGPDRTAVG